MRTSMIFATATALAATLVSIPAGTASARTSCAELEIQAHRGYHFGSEIDQNTLRSFNQANKRGYTIETDVWRDAEGQLWIFHDRDVSKLTNGNGLIDRMSTKQVNALRYKKAGSPLPKFGEAVAAWSNYPRRRIYIEPKQQTAIPAMVRQLRAAGLVGNVYFAGYWDYVEKNFPAFRSQPKSTTYYGPAHWAGHDAVMTGGRLITRDGVAAYHRAGLEVLHFRTNRERAWTRALRRNFDGILTDRPDQLKAFCRR